MKQEEFAEEYRKNTIQAEGDEGWIEAEAPEVWDWLNQNRELVMKHYGYTPALGGMPIRKVSKDELLKRYPASQRKERRK